MTSNEKLTVKAVQPGVVADIREGDYGEKLVVVLDDDGGYQEYVTDEVLAEPGKVLRKDQVLGRVNVSRVR